MNTGIVARPGPAVPAAPPRLMEAVQAAVVAEALLKVRTNRATASLSDLGRGTRQRYEDAAAIALALLEDDADVPALYAAADHLCDLGAQTAAQRRELVALAHQVVDRYHEVLAGHHVMRVERLRPFIEIDQREGAEAR